MKCEHGAGFRRKPEWRPLPDRKPRQSHYPTLNIEPVNGAIAFCLNHKDEVEQAMEERRREEDAYFAAHPAPPDIQEKFERMRRQILARRS